MRSLSLILIFSFALLGLGCSNIFSSMAQKTTDDAIYEDATKAIDQQDWDTALTKLGSLSTAYQSKTDVIEAYAGAYAGKCGLNFITYFNSLGTASLTGSTLFKYLMNGFTGTAVNPTYCTLAQLKMEQISASPAGRTSGENLFMAILGMVKIGTYLRARADQDGTGGLGDGTFDATYRSCNTTSLSNADAVEVLTGIGLLTNNITYLSAVLSGNAITGALTQLTTVCTGGTCTNTTASAVTSADVTVVRALLRTSSANPVAPLGIEDCVNPVVTACCP